MVSNETLRQHLARRDAVRNIEKSLHKLSSVHCEPDVLESNSVQILPMSLMATSPSFQPWFYEPYDKELLDPDREWIGDEFPQFGGLTDGYTPLDSTGEICDYFFSYLSFLRFENPETPSPKQRTRNSGLVGFPELAEIRPGNGWRGTEISFELNRPHFKCSMISDYVADDRLMRCELLCICRVMRTLLNARSLADHMVTPVMILSWVGSQHCRFLLAHHDGKNLVIRKSELLDFRKENVPALKIVARWWLSSLVGDTISP